MILETLVLFVEFVVQMAFLFAALWIMIKIQKLNYNFPGLLGSAALVSGLDRALDTVLGHFLGNYLATYISAPVTLVVLIICIAKVTRADRVDVLFTIVVGYALMFGMNLWLFGALRGDLRPSARNPGKLDTVAQQPETNKVYQTVIKTNQPVQSAHQPAPTVSTNAAMQKGPAKPVAVATNLFSIKGVARNGSSSAVTIQTGKRIYTISLGESALTQTTNGLVSVRFKELRDGWVVLTINGQETKLPFP
ncbi:MAG: hypothetical protein WBW41_17995 [Verrucomicrobiia bacterium]